MLLGCPSPRPADADSAAARPSSLRVGQASQVVLMLIHVWGQCLACLCVNRLPVPLERLRGAPCPTVLTWRLPVLMWRTQEDVQPELCGSSLLAQGKLRRLTQQLQVGPEASVLRKCSLRWSVTSWKQGGRCYHLYALEFWASHSTRNYTKPLDLELCWKAAVRRHYRVCDSLMLAVGLGLWKRIQTNKGYANLPPPLLKSPLNTPHQCMRLVGSHKSCLFFFRSGKKASEEIEEYVSGILLSSCGHLCQQLSLGCHYLLAFVGRSIQT